MADKLKVGDIFLEQGDYSVNLEKVLFWDVKKGSDGLNLKVRFEDFNIQYPIERKFIVRAVIQKLEEFVEEDERDI